MGEDHTFVDSNEFHPGCMWGLIHSLHWSHHVKRLLPLSPKKHNRHKHVTGSRRSKITLDIDDSNEVQSLLDDQEVGGKFLVDADTKKIRSPSPSKRSIMSRIKSLVSEEMSKEEKLSLKQQKGQAFSPHRQLRRTYSIHHLETLSHGSTKGKVTGWRQKIVFLPNKPDSIHPAQIKITDNEIPSQTETLINEEYMDPEQHHGNNDILEIFSINKDLFQKFFSNTDEDDTTIHLRSPQISDRRARLSKSGSFPQTDQSYDRSVRSSKLNHKIDEVWSFKKNREKLLSSKSGPLHFHYDGESNTKDHEESKFIEEDNCKGSDHYGHRRTHVRATSLEDSLDKYIQLLEHSSGSGRDAMSYRSKSLMLRNEYEITSELTQPRMSFKRVLSLPHVEFCKEDAFFGEMEEVVEEENEMSLSADDQEAENSHTENINEETANPNELMITDGSNFNYVKKILELSGFTSNDLLGAWSSSESPLDPSLYEDMETYWPSDHDDTTSSFSDHQILFDLTNEAIIQIYDRSYAYYPKALSWSCWVRPLPLGNHFLEEILARIDRSFNRRTEPEPEQPVDWIMGGDLLEDLGWMNLQFESECVALEIEELLIDELLDEVVYNS